MPLDTTPTRRRTDRPVAVEHRAIGPRHGHTRYVADPLAPSDGAARQRAEARVTELEAALAAAHGTIRTLTAQAERMARETRAAVEARQAAEARAAALERQAAPPLDPAGAQEPRTLTGAELRALREARGWTQAEVGRRAGVWQALVSLVERDQAAAWNVAAVQRALTAGEG